MQDTMLNLRAFFKAQSALTRIELRTRATQGMYVALALGFGLLGLGMLNIGAFLALEPVLGAAGSAVILGIADVLLAAGIVRVAAGVTSGSAGVAARERRDLVVDSLLADAEQLTGRLQGIQADIGRVRMALSSVSFGAGALLPGISSVVGLLISALKKRKA